MTDLARRINRRQQGDLGEASALEWFTSVGATVLVPFGHSPDYDLVVEIDGRLLRVQVKTSTQQVLTPHGHARCTVSIATNGGNQSWSGRTKRFDASRAEFLFVLTGDGRRWLIPSRALECRNAVTLGGPKYAEYEIKPGNALRSIVYGESSSLESATPLGEYPRGQRMAAVNRPAQPSQVRLLPPPSEPLTPSKYERSLGKSGHAVINQKRRVTLPGHAVAEAGFRDGERVKVRAEGLGRMVLEKAGLPLWAEPA